MTSSLWTAPGIKIHRVPNELILENARLISDKRREMQIRIPVIPLFNDDEANIRKPAASALAWAAR
jgi:pyruvate-formate lyase-activating enzyme